MQNQGKSTRDVIAETKSRLEILEEIDLLDSEFGLIRNEYVQRRKHLAERLKALEITVTDPVNG